MSSLLSLVAAKAKLAAVLAGTALVSAAAVGGGGALVFSNVSDEKPNVVQVVDPVVEPVVDPVGEPVVKQPNPNAVANHSGGKGRDDERAAIRGGGSRDPHATENKGQGKK